LNILITICARAGSKGIPGKNSRLLKGKPLIVYSIESAISFSTVFPSDIVVTTDDNNIKELVKKYTPVAIHDRPPHLATDTAGKIETITDVLAARERESGKEYDYVLDMDVTSPLRTLNDLIKAFEVIQEDEHAYNIFSVNPANRNPYFNMVEEKENGYYHLVKEGKFLSRQTAPRVYDMNASFYFYRRHFFKSGLTTSTTPKSLIYIMPHICFDLDHPVDFEFMEYLLMTDKLGFEL
jgi:CMP-N,N'-diacetyllegionaminic acid synthase